MASAAGTERDTHSALMSCESVLPTGASGKLPRLRHTMMVSACLSPEDKEAGVGIGSKRALKEAERERTLLSSGD